MTEKRYEVFDDGFAKYIEDTYYKEDRHEYNLYDVWGMCCKLNELYEENMRLREENERLENKLWNCQNMR